MSLSTSRSPLEFRRRSPSRSTAMRRSSRQKSRPRSLITRKMLLKQSKPGSTPCHHPPDRRKKLPPYQTFLGTQQPPAPPACIPGISRHQHQEAAQAGQPREGGAGDIGSLLETTIGIELPSMQDKTYFFLEKKIKRPSLQL